MNYDYDDIHQGETEHDDGLEDAWREHLNRNLTSEETAAMWARFDRWQDDEIGLDEVYPPTCGARGALVGLPVPREGDAPVPEPVEAVRQVRAKPRPLGPGMRGLGDSVADRIDAAQDRLAERQREHRREQEEAERAWAWRTGAWIW